MPFKTDPLLRVGPGDNEWTLESPLYYATKSGVDIVVPPGFITDLASIPRVLHSLIPVNGRHRAAAIIHDWLYETQRLTRAESDRIFLDAMADSGVSWTQRHVLYIGVRAGGWVVWGRRAPVGAEPTQ